MQQGIVFNVSQVDSMLFLACAMPTIATKVGFIHGGWLGAAHEAHWEARNVGGYAQKQESPKSDWACAVQYFVCVQ